MNARAEAAAAFAVCERELHRAWRRHGEILPLPHSLPLSKGGPWIRVDLN
jgi:hypothetical protein